MKTLQKISQRGQLKNLRPLSLAPRFSGVYQRATVEETVLTVSPVNRGFSCVLESALISLLLLVALTFNAHAQTTDLVKISGSVVDKQGHPVTDAAVDCYRFPNQGLAMAMPDVESKQHTTTDGAGAFSLSIPSGAATVVASKSGLAPAWKSFQSAPDHPLDPLVLSTPTVLAGVVLDENNHPLANAVVIVSMAMDNSDIEGFGERNFLFGKAASQLFSARTSDDGRFRIENFPSGGQANLTVNIPGRALRPPSMARNGFQMQAQSGQQDIKLITDPAAGIEGKVVLRDNGAPLAGANLQVQTTSAGALMPFAQSVHSAADGSFRIPGLPSGSYTVTAIFTNQPLAPWVAERVPVTVTAGETARNVTIEAFKGGVIEVTVVGKSDQKALSGANISAYAQGYQAASTTGANGIALLRLPPGPFTISAMKQGRAQAQTQTSVTDGATNRVRLVLNSPFQITGTVRDASGGPVANAIVGIVPKYSGEPSVKSDATGHYDVTWEKPPWAGAQNQRFYLVARSQEHNLAALREINDATTSLDVELKSAMSISGRVQDTKGKPITNATAYLLLQMENNSFSIDRDMLHADQQGRIQVPALPSGQNYNLYASAKGYGSANQQMDNTNPKAGHYDFPPIVLNLADRKLAGRVLGTNGQPAAGVQVGMNGDGQPNGNIMTDANGRFAFDVCQGPITVWANEQGLYASTDTMAGDTNVVIRFNSNNRVFGQNSLTVSGTVYDSSGRPAIGAHVTVSPAWGMTDSATTDENGDYSVNWQDQTGMRGAKYFVIARDTEQNLAGIEPVDAKTTHVSVHLGPGFSISGTVLDSEGAPLTHANVNLNIMAGNMGGMVDQQPPSIGSDGSFTIPALPPGQQYNLWITASGYGSGQKSISKPQSSTNKSIQLAPFKLRTADRDLAGQVLDSDGKPLSSAWVYINGNNQPNGNIRSDSTGHFKFKVCPGPIQVNAYRQSGGPNNWGSTQARGGDLNVVVKLGANPARNGNMARSRSFKPAPWTLGAFIAWPADHKKASMVLLSSQMAVLLGTVGVVLWATRKRSP